MTNYTVTEMDSYTEHVFDNLVEAIDYMEYVDCDCMLTVEAGDGLDKIIGGKVNGKVSVNA